MENRKAVEYVLKSANGIGFELRTCNRKLEMNTPRNLFFTTEAQSSLFFCPIGRYRSGKKPQPFGRYAFISLFVRNYVRQNWLNN